MAGLEDFRSTADEAHQMWLMNPVNPSVVLEEDEDPMFLMLYGQEGQRFRNLENKQKTSGFNRFRKNQNAPLTADLVEEEEFQRTFVCIASWHIYYEGRWLDQELNEKMVREVFQKVPFVYTQTKDYIKDTSNFLPSVENNSVSLPGGSSGKTSPQGKISPVPLRNGRDTSERTANQPPPA